MNATVPLSAARLSGHVRRVVPWSMLDEWGDMMAIIDQVIEDKLWLYAKPGFWNDLGPLTVGAGKMKHSQYEAQFALWCIFKSQLFLTNKPYHIGAATTQLITNRDLLDINQDELGESARLVNESKAVTNYGQNQVVAKPCDGTRNQLWTYDSISHKINHVATRQCLTYNRDNYVSVGPCNTGNTDVVTWHVESAKPPDDPKDKQIIYPFYNNNNKVNKQCLTLSTHKGVPATVRVCSARQQTRNWQGPNQAWHGFNDAFEQIQHEDHIQFKNKAGMCLAVGGSADKQVFAGKLSQNRHVVLLLNRAPHDHPILFHFKHLNLDLSKEYVMFDVLKNTSHGPKKDAFEDIVAGRSVKVYIMRPLE